MNGPLLEVDDLWNVTLQEVFFYVFSVFFVIGFVAVIVIDVYVSVCVSMIMRASIIHLLKEKKTAFDRALHLFTGDNPTTQLHNVRVRNILLEVVLKLVLPPGSQSLNQT